MIFKGSILDFKYESSSNVFNMINILDKFKEIYFPRRYKKSKKPFQKTSQHHVSRDRIRSSGNTDKIMKLKVKNYVKNPMSDYLQQNEPNFTSNISKDRENEIFTNMRLFNESKI